jgi:hypothetical protein
MVNGAFRCIGTHKEVKELYGQGRELSLKLVAPTKEEVAKLMASWGDSDKIVHNTRRTVIANNDSGALEVTAGMISREKLVAWAEKNDPWLAQAVNSAVAPFPEPTPDSVASTAVLGEWYLNAKNAKNILEWVKTLDSSAEWLAWASTTFRFKLFGGGSLPSLFDNMYKNKERLKMMEYAVSPTSLEQIFHAFAKEQTGSTEEQGVYSNAKEKALQALLESVESEEIEANV